MGYLIYIVIFAGLGCWPKLNLPAGYSSIGIRLLLGYAGTLILGFLMLIAGLKIYWITVILVVLGSVGAIYRLIDGRTPFKLKMWFTHPGIVFIAFGFVVVIFQSNLNYLPVGHDEFSHWLAHPLHLHTHETLNEALKSFSLPGYLPGWPMILSIPWQLSGEAHFGASAAAPFFFCVAVIAFAYDIVAGLLRRYLKLGPSRVLLYSWSIILLLTSVQALGPLWSRTLLIEAPQVYSISAVVLLLYTSHLYPSHRNSFEWCAGVVLAAAYIIKSAAILFVPGIFLICFYRFWFKRKSRRSYLSEAIAPLFRLSGPVIAIAFTWSLYSEAFGCLARPLETLSQTSLIKAFSYDWLDLAKRLFHATGVYIIDYKFVLTIFSLFSCIYAFYRKNDAIIVLFLMIICYFTSLYWFHLSCFGDYYFRELNSIPRFTRVILWTLHTVGLIVFIEMTLKAVQIANLKQRFEALITKRYFIGLSFTIFCVLALIQVGTIWRSVEDISTRRYQALDPRIKESKKAAETIDKLVGVLLPEMPRLLVLSQGLDNSVLSHADFFAQSRKRGITNPNYTVIREVSWAPTPENIWQTRANSERFIKRMQSADLIWPMYVDDWLLSAMKQSVDDRKCLAELTQYFLIKDQTSKALQKFRCYPKFSFDGD